MATIDEIPSDFWEKEILVGEIIENEFNKTQITLTLKNEQRYINIRKMYKNKKEGSPWKQGKGSTIKASLAPDVVPIIVKALEELPKAIEDGRI